MRSKLAPDGSFWSDLAGQFDEKAAKEKLDGQIAQQERAIALASRVLALRGAPGFEDFRKSLQDIRDYAIEQLTQTKASNDWMRVLQGQVQAYENMLAVMEKQESRLQALDRALKELQNQRTLLERPMPRTDP